MQKVFVVLLTLAAWGAPAAAQEAASAAFTESATFIVRRGDDTVAIERFRRGPMVLKGVLYLRLEVPITEKISAVIDSTGTMPLVEVVEFRNSDTLDTSPSQHARIIFRDDSVAVDALTGNGIQTRLFQTERGALPYLNLSFALLEQAVRRGLLIGGDTVALPFFNLGGGQTATGTLARNGSSATLTLGRVPIVLELDATGRIVKGEIASQGVTVTRVDGAP
ncbi:MAG: hypothetical protein ACOY71_09160 [Gemmatimonadota bacterium]